MEDAHETKFLYKGREVISHDPERMLQVLQAIDVAAEQGKQRIFKIRRWINPGFNIGEQLTKTKGIFIEVAGPTFGGYDIIDLGKLNKKLYTSNITPGLAMCDYRDLTRKYLGTEGKTDFVAEAEHLPFPNNSLGAIFASCFWSEKLLEEAARTLEHNGILILQDLSKRKLVETEKLLKGKMTLQESLCQYSHEGSFSYLSPHKSYSVVFSKT